MRFILPAFFIWRLLLFIPLFVGNVFLPYRAGYDFTNVLNKIPPESILNNFLVFPWANFDGVHYLSIAGYGYITEGQFFPLFPILIHIISSFFGSVMPFGLTSFFTALFISNLSFFIALLVFYKLVSLDFSRNIAKWSVIFLLFFPTSFYFASIYSESLFLLLSLLAFYFARKRQWVLVGIFGFLLTATRLVGIIILPVLLYEFFNQEKVKEVFKTGRWKAMLFKATPLFFMPLAFLGFAWFNWHKWGNAFYFIQNHGTLGNSRSVESIVLFPQTVIRYFKIFTALSPAQYEWWIALLEILVFVFVSIVLYLAWKKSLRFSYILYFLLAFLIPISSGTFSGLPRYVLVLFPVFITLALLKNRYAKIFYSLVGVSILLVLLVFFSRGYFVA